jgi:hypothetical protein
MQGELARLDGVLRARLGDQALGERRALVRREHPADDIAAGHRGAHNVWITCGDNTA